MILEMYSPNYETYVEIKVVYINILTNSLLNACMCKSSVSINVERRRRLCGYVGSLAF